MGEGGEFDAIRRLLAVWGDGARGIGDDAAVLSVAAGQRLVVSTDASIEGVHFRSEWLTAEEIGGRAAASALSDLAAMAARPLGLLLALSLPDARRPELEAIAAGVGRVASSVDCPIVGGNISAGASLALTITVLGQAERPLMRGGARAGDVICVTGVLGGPGLALRALLAGEVPSPELRARFASPSPRIREAMWLAEHGATSAIDISDGLLAEAGHVARASGVSLEIDAGLLPLWLGANLADALVSGEEYELMVTAPEGVDVDAFARRCGTPLTRIGLVRVAGDAPVIVRDADVAGMQGHDHLG